MRLFYLLYLLNCLLHSRRDILTKMASFKDYTSICSSAPSEYLSIIGLRNKDKLIQRNMDIIQNNLILLDAFFAKYSKYFSWIRPTAGAIAFPRLMLDIVDVGVFCNDLVKKKGVLLLPG